MSEAIAERDRRLGNFISATSFEEYRARFAPHFRLERRDGILVVRMHYNNGSAIWSRGLLNAWNLLLGVIGADRGTEVVVFTGTGDAWIGGVEAESFAQPLSQWGPDLVHEQYTDGIKILERLVFDLDVPTIAAINGPGIRMELPLLCDLTLCTPDVSFGDGNFRAGSVPGDGMYLMLRDLVGVKRANHIVYTGQRIPAEDARQLGLVNEVLPRAELLTRALDLAAEITTVPRTARRLTHAVMARAWQRRLVSELRDHYAHQLLSMTTRDA
ncbi:enoyl-CoA hydratase/isomerase family protein [Nocardia sp. NPDC101769]|uniref:enoyl-CoA hydratase/isomerase family protein n=1 Tax=Nocardia sp. NPDC101769 TaxID=3364333 RepID=UPI00380E5EAB